MTAQNLYRQDEQDAVASCPLDDMVLLYHGLSGQTHMVISPVPEILAALTDGAAVTATQLYDRLSQLYDLGPQAEAIAEIEAHLATLTALGLVRMA